MNLTNLQAWLLREILASLLPWVLGPEQAIPFTGLVGVDVEAGPVSYVIHMPENICLWEETRLGLFTGAGTVEQGDLWEIYFFSFLLADFMWSSWDETQKES